MAKRRPTKQVEPAETPLPDVEPLPYLSVTVDHLTVDQRVILNQGLHEHRGKIVHIGTPAREKRIETAADFLRYLIEHHAKCES